MTKTFKAFTFLILMAVLHTPELQATDLEACRKNIKDLYEQGKNLASKRGLKGILDKAQIGAIRTRGDTSSLDHCFQTLEKMSEFVKALTIKVSLENK